MSLRVSAPADVAAEPAGGHGGRRRGLLADSPAGWGTPAVIAAQRALACAAPDPDVVLAIVADAARRLLRADGAVTWARTRPPAGALVVARATAGSTRTSPGDVTTYPPSPGDLSPHTTTGAGIREGAASSVVVPLVHDGEPVAWVVVLSSLPDAFDECDHELLELLAEVGGHRLGHALALDAHDALKAQSDAVLQAMTAGLVVLDRDSVIVFANQAAQDVLGLSLEQLLGRSNHDPRWAVVNEDCSACPGEAFPSSVTLATGATQQDRLLGLHRPDGQLRWLLVNTVPMRDRSGALTGVVCSFDDVTARRDADTALLDTRRRLEAARDLAGLATWEVDLASGALRWSAEMFTIVGLDQVGGDLDAQAQRSLVHPDDLPQLDAVAQACVTSREPAQLVVRALRADGTVRFLWTQMDVAVDHTGAVSTLWGTTQDITEREQAAQALAASEQHFRLAFDNAPIGMSMLSLAPGSAGRYLRANEQFHRMLGYSADELTSRTMADLTHPEDVLADQRRFDSITNGETTSVAFDKRFRRKDGETVFAWLTSSVAHGPAGEPLYLVTHAVDLTEQRSQQAELERLALTDTLTGLANRTLLTDRLDQALARLQRVDTGCALLLLDVDRFKLVNDSFGHQVGDALLVEVASRLEAVCRADATVARLGGDEFVVLVEGLHDPDEVHPVAARILAALRRPYALGDAGDCIVATVSIGISVATTPDRSHSDLYREADLALYRAKDSGRDQYALFDAALRSRVLARMEAETLLRRALADDRVTPYFQPIVDLATGGVVGVECLARIMDPERGVVGPADFVDVAEETGLVAELDARMLELGVRQLSPWSREGLGLHHLSANVSARSLEDPSLVDRLRRVMAWYDVAGAAVHVEITERSLLATNPVSAQSLRRIAQLGVDLGLDDFGTGYSALAYLQRFDLRFLKIDRSFVSRLGHPRDDAVVAAVIDLAHAHDLVVVAEGVEVPEQLAALRTMGCDRAQGYLMGRPMPPEELLDLLRRSPSW